MLQIVSQAEAQGEVAVQELAEIQGQSFDSARVLVSNQIGGMEDIPVSLLPSAARPSSHFVPGLNAVTVYGTHTLVTRPLGMGCLSAAGRQLFSAACPSSHFVPGLDAVTVSGTHPCDTSTGDGLPICRWQAAILSCTPLISLSTRGCTVLLLCLEPTPL